MSPEEVKQLQHAGQVLLINISNIIAKSVLYGLYLAIFAFGIRALLNRNPWTKYTWTLSGFLSVMFLMSTANVATVISTTIVLIRGAFINNVDQPLKNRLQLADASVEGLEIAGIWFGASSGGGFLFVFADTVVVWRACVLCAGNRIAKVLTSALLLASFGSVIVSAVLDTISVSQSEVVPTSTSTGIMLALSQSLSLATNVVATILIGYKTYYHRQMLKNTMGMQSSRSGAILLFLAESGVIFCILQILALVTAVSADTGLTTLDYAAKTWQDITTFAAAAYPVLVLIIVDSHRSISDHTGSAADSGAAQGSNSLGVGSHLSFAAPPPGLSSSGGEVGTDSSTVSRIDAASGGDDSDTVGAIRFRDLEKGEGLDTSALASPERR